jgi:hypothetical protein
VGLYNEEYMTITCRILIYTIIIAIGVFYKREACENEEIFTYFARGYFEEMGSKLTEREKELLPFSAKLLTYECGIRFLTDYLNGDTYFRIHRENQNLDRARNQFKLVRDIEEKEAELAEIIKNI